MLLSSHIALSCHRITSCLGPQLTATMSGLPTFPVEEGHKFHLIRKTSKQTKLVINRASKTSIKMENNSTIVNEIGRAHV